MRTHTHTHTHTHAHTHVFIYVCLHTKRTHFDHKSVTWWTIPVPRRILKDIDDEKEYPDPCDAALEHEETAHTATPDSGHYDNSNHGNNGDRVDNNNYWDSDNDRTDDGGRDGSPELDIDGEPSYLPKPSTINYNAPVTPDPQSPPNPGNEKDGVEI